MSRLRPLFAVPLAAAVVGGVLAAGLPALSDHLDRPHREKAQAVASALRAPAGSVTSTACRGDGQVACWETAQPVRVTADGLRQAMGERAETVAALTCEQVPIETTGSHFSADSCFVRVRFADHGTFAFIDPIVERDAAGVATVVGARISLSAA
ncbi:hypothetical protein [Kineococcus glutinatus]|uniref:Uncharacterized protein n=1 Tax=Kineococcus glutinatus TaxID=1070872 RepID=A0ABP9HQ87_9ACTN